MDGRRGDERDAQKTSSGLIQVGTDFPRGLVLRSSLIG